MVWPFGRQKRRKTFKVVSGIRRLEWLSRMDSYSRYRRNEILQREVRKFRRGDEE